MPAILSKEFAAKLLGSEWSFGYNCYEVGHTWTPSCSEAALEVSLAAALKVMPLYAILYTFSQVAVQRRPLEPAASWETAKSICRSSFFIFFHAYNGSMMGCALRRGFGRFYYRVLVCAPALLSSYLSLLIEKPARRQALAFYLLNLASEIVFRMLVTKGHLRPIRHGETLLFAVSLAAWYYFLKRHGFGHDPISGAVKVLIGRDEAKSRATTTTTTTTTTSTTTRNIIHKETQLEHQDNTDTITTTKSWSKQVKCAKLIERLASATRLGPKLDCCPHRQATCFEYVMGPAPTRFLLGHLIQSLLKVSSRPLELLQNPGACLRDSFTSPGSIRFGLFLASLVSAGRLTSCLLRRWSQSNDHHWHALVSGFVAGLSMLWAPRSSLSMYVMWKAVEQYYLLAQRQGNIAYFQFQILTIYSVSAATILYTFALEPRFVRPSYMKFLDRLSDHRLHQLNRMVLDVFGTGSSVGYEDYFPDLDPKYMSNQFKELVFNWMIQPYE